MVQVVLSSRMRHTTCGRKRSGTRLVVHAYRLIRRASSFVGLVSSWIRDGIHKENAPMCATSDHDAALLGIRKRVDAEQHIGLITPRICHDCGFNMMV